MLRYAACSFGRFALEPSQLQESGRRIWPQTCVEKEAPKVWSDDEYTGVEWSCFDDAVEKTSGRDSRYMWEIAMIRGDQSGKRRLYGA
jgi:hypothetical protein